MYVTDKDIRMRSLKDRCMQREAAVTSLTDITSAVLLLCVLWQHICKCFSSLVQVRSERDYGERSV